VRGFYPAVGRDTRRYGSTDLDAALLILPLLGIEDPGSPRVDDTVNAVRDGLSAGGPLLYRYPPGRAGLPGTEGAFQPCSFWLVQALASPAAAQKPSSCSRHCPTKRLFRLDRATRVEGADVGRP